MPHTIPMMTINASMRPRHPLSAGPEHVRPGTFPYFLWGCSPWPSSGLLSLEMASRIVVSAMVFCIW